VTAHRFTSFDRGAGHLHRYTPKCSCGWIGVHRRTVTDAKNEWAEVPAHWGNAHPLVRPGTLTPLDQLPEALR
jgi:hypothetical protein